MENKLNHLFNIELLKRLISVIIFLPIVLIPILYSNYLLVLIYMIFNSIIICELMQMKNNQLSVRLLNIYIPATIFSFFIFIFINLTEVISTLMCLEILFTIWIFDTTCYIGGKLVGGKKLIPSISAGKTISGLLIGFSVTLIIIQTCKSFMFTYSFVFFYQTILVIFFSFIGDILGSILKRISNVKDSGSIMPGHGGLFDRFDSFIAVFLLYGIHLLAL